MRLFDPRALARFGGMSLLTLAVQVGVTTLLVRGLGWTPGGAYNAALITVILVSFPIMRHRVYGKATGDAGRQLAAYAVATLVFRGAERLSFEWVHGVLGVQYQISIVLIAGVFSVIKFFFYGLTLFRGGGAGRKKEASAHGVSGAPGAGGTRPR